MYLSNLCCVSTVSIFLIFYNANSYLMLKSRRVNELNNSKTKNWTAFIVNGKPVSVSEFPTAVIFFNFGNMCAGSILNSWTILTAAHCLNNNKDVIDMLIQVGTTFSYEMGADRYEVLYFDIHPSYSLLTQFDCDIALVYVRGPIVLGPKAKKAILVHDQKWINATTVPEFLVSGWGLLEENGSISDDGLMMTRLSLVSNKRCKTLHDTMITDNMFCLYGDGVTDTCHGDSGGGVTWRGFLVGIVSHGDGCANDNKPSIYTNVYKFLEWIKKKISKFYHNYCKTKGFTLDILKLSSAS